MAQSDVYVLENPRKYHRRNPTPGFIEDGSELAKDAALTAGGFGLAGFLSHWFPRFIKANGWVEGGFHVVLGLVVVGLRKTIPGGARVAVDLANGIVLRGLLTALNKSGLALPGGRYLPTLPSGIGGGGMLARTSFGPRMIRTGPAAFPLPPTATMAERAAPLSAGRAVLR